MLFTIPRKKNTGAGIHPGDTIDLLGLVGLIRDLSFLLIRYLINNLAPHS